MSCHDPSVSRRSRGVALKLGSCSSRARAPPVPGVVVVLKAGRSWYGGFPGVNVGRRAHVVQKESPHVCPPHLFWLSLVTTLFKNVVGLLTIPDIPSTHLVSRRMSGFGGGRKKEKKESRYL